MEKAQRGERPGFGGIDGLAGQGSFYLADGARARGVVRDHRGGVGIDALGAGKRADAALAFR